MNPKNLLKTLQDTVLARPEAPSLRFKKGGSWQALTWQETFDKICTLAGGLKRLGIQKGDRVSIFSPTRYEWTIADMAVLSCGGVTVPIYESSRFDTAEYILDNAEVKVLFVDGLAQLEKVRKVHKNLKNLKQIIVFDEFNGFKREDGIYTLADVFDLSDAEEGKKIFDQMVKEITPDHEASFVYTSGTTGPPKGAILTHGNFLAELEAVEPVFDLNPQNNSLLFLPLAHIFARLVQFAQIKKGFIQDYAESIDRLLDNITEVSPSFLGSVPRIFEKIHTKVMQGVESGSALKKGIFAWSVAVGRKRAQLLAAHQEVPPLLQLQWLVAYRLVFSKLHEKMGGRLNFFVSGGAPLGKEIADFFMAAGFIILEGYGLTETSAAITCNSLADYKSGTVGKVLHGAEIKLAPDGEILVKGEMVFKGYYKNPEATAEVLTSDGWFHTGDIGVFDETGHLKITDRKKDIIVTAGGKNVAPQNIENLIKTDALISQIVVHGDKRKFLSALITLDKAEILQHAKQNNISYKEYGDLIKNEKVHQLIKARLDEKNKQLAKYETIKKFEILENDFTIESGELTPTLKVKRKFVSEKYKEVFDGFYQE